MIAIFSTFPINKGESLSAEVAKVIDAISKSGLPYQTTAMGTIVEGQWDEVMALIKKCHYLVRKSNNRVNTRISIDDRKGARGRISGKVESIEARLGRKVNK